MSSINDIICAYIYKEWVKPSKSQRAFATEHNIEESTVRKIKKSAQDGENYNIPILTLHRICEARNMTVSKFLKRLDL